MTRPGFWTRAVALGSQRLTARAMAWPGAQLISRAMRTRVSFYGGKTAEAWGLPLTSI
jgi:hypothetical protein